MLGAQGLSQQQAATRIQAAVRGMLSRRRHNSTDEQEELLFLGMAPWVSPRLVAGTLSVCCSARMHAWLVCPAWQLRVCHHLVGLADWACTAQQAVQGIHVYRFMFASAAWWPCTRQIDF